MTTVETISTTAPAPRGTASQILLELLSREPGSPASDVSHLAETVDRALADSGDLLTDDDLQLTLFILYLLHYGPVPFVVGDWEWHPGLLAVRARIEAEFETALRKVVQLPDAARGDNAPTGAEVTQMLFDLTNEVARPELAMWAARHATDEQLREFLILRSIYTLREADPHSWAIPRLRGRAKAALVEIQSDEYGGGRPERLHASIFARTLRGMGLSDTPDAYLNLVPAVTLASVNTMSFFGLHRRLRGAIVGHLAAFEMTSSLPNKHYGNAFRRLGHGPEVTWYYDEHVEADAVHEQIAARDLAGSLADDDPEVAADIVFGACASLHMDDLVGAHLKTAWTEGHSALREAR
ncbi:iron-containing redox enzyme family protein [Corynebacterium halotolerans]|uniref:Iron-containing redox enzyme family protein n=1 Tax=Corynebacterium halotolerans YIM 70093 = DSM 44683 TaxID=1121362 RepID=M1NP71_9CORY|nr:iron-containing redox enzyme family protein [Corynebacterium halotolerans]AGF73168.1 hypothetical protein A605_10840 [Corynebacterium halotolerans YIM 70093 = DSM 44683]